LLLRNINVEPRFRTFRNAQAVENECVTFLLSPVAASTVIFQLHKSVANDEGEAAARGSILYYSKSPFAKAMISTSELTRVG
jgi:hypothetical protein